MSLFGMMGTVGAVAGQAMIQARNDAVVRRNAVAQVARTRRQITAVQALGADLRAARLEVDIERRRADAAEQEANRLAARLLKVEAMLKAELRKSWQ